MNGKQVKQGKKTDPRIVAKCLGPHVSGHRPRQRNDQKGRHQQESGAMASVEMVAFAEEAATAKPVENTISHVEQPSGNGEKQRLDER